MTEEKKVVENAPKQAEPVKKTAKKVIKKEDTPILPQQTVAPQSKIFSFLSDDTNHKISKRVEGFVSWFFPGNWEDGEFMDDVRQATLRGAHPATNILFWCVTTFLLAFLFWANICEIDMVTNGEGRVIPSGNIQTVQYGNQGVIKEILVTEGELVDKGKVLIRIDDTSFQSFLNERKTAYYSALADIARLEAEIEGTEVIYPNEILKDAPHVVDSVQALYLSRLEERRNTLSVLERQVEQRRQEYKELESNMNQTARNYEISKKEYDLTKPLLDQGVVSEVEMLRLERQVNDLLGEKDKAELALPRAESSIQEAESRLDEAKQKIRTEILTELSKKKVEKTALEERLKADEFNVDRTVVRSPVRGQVKKVHVNTVDGFVGPQDPLVDLLPLDDYLVVEARIRPKDIAFLKEDAEATVKLTAYDFSIYGGLKGRLFFIGKDTELDERGNPYYIIKVKTDKNYLGKEDNPLPIIPGMVATVDILMGKRTIMDYILKPFRKMKANALSER